MTVRAKLKDLAPGTVFNAGPIDVRVLEHFADGRTLLIADTCIADRHFADQPFKTRPEKPAETRDRIVQLAGGGINDRTICKKDRPWLGFLGRRSGRR